MQQVMCRLGDTQALFLPEILVSIHGAWHGVNSQQDVAEYLAYILPRLGMAESMGRWSARMMIEDRIVVTDSGSLVNALGLSVEDTDPEPIHLSSAMRRWSEDVARHALDASVPWLALMYPRFRTEDTITRRDERVLGLTERISIPHFTGRDMSIEHRTYSIAAVIVHHGDTPRSSNYYCYIRSRLHDCWWRKEDSQLPIQVRSIPHSDLRSVYLILLVRTDSDSEGHDH